MKKSSTRSSLRTSRLKKREHEAFPRVLSVNPKGHQKQIVSDRTPGIAPIILHRFAMVGVGNRLKVGTGHRPRIWAIGEEGVEIPLVPIFEEFGNHLLAGRQVPTRVSELSTPEEMRDYASLEAFHYRGVDFSSATTVGANKKNVGGRRAVLLLQIQLGRHWVAAGYVELQMPLMMAKPRHEAFSRPYKHPKLDVTWQTWKKGGQQLVNRIARIARVVVHPEMRGAGLSTLLVQSSIRFARERWHIGGKQALFLEISAEMLRHIDFVSPSGFHYLGDTEGNKIRLAKDLGSLKNGAGGKSGIMSLQRRYFALFESYRLATGESFEAMRTRIAELLGKDEPWNEMSLDEWIALRPVIRSPIPYFMIGLDEYSNSYVRQAAQRLSTGKAAPPRKVHRPKELRVTRLTLWSNYEVPTTKYNRLVMNGFGITAKTIKTRLVGPISFTAQPGTITFIGGSSGSGKSLLLASFDPLWKVETVFFDGQVVPATSTTGWLRPLPPSTPLFEYLAEKHGPERTFDALSRVGLSEALLFLRPYQLLSRGQRYRAMLADLILADHHIWLIDEFCSDLDPLSALMVAHRLRETVRRENRVAIVAAANHGHFISALKPAQVVMLSLGGDASLCSWKECADGLFR